AADAELPVRQGDQIQVPEAVGCRQGARERVVEVDALRVRALAEVPVPLLVPRARAVEAEREVELVLLRPQIHAGPPLQAVLEVVLPLEPRAIRQARPRGRR